nr:Tetraspanin-6 [Ipomoea batatas]
MYNSDSNTVICFLNLLTLLASIPIIGAGLWMARSSTTCEKFLQTPLLVIGFVILIVSLAGFIGRVSVSRGRSGKLYNQGSINHSRPPIGGKLCNSFWSFSFYGGRRLEKGIMFRVLCITSHYVCCTRTIALSENDTVVTGVEVRGGSSKNGRVAMRERGQESRPACDGEQRPAVETGSDGGQLSAATAGSGMRRAVETGGERRIRCQTQWGGSGGCGEWWEDDGKL